MSASIWAYPWDLHDLGPEVLPRLQALGIDTVSLATSYHAGRFLQPGNPRRRVHFPQDGTVYTHLDPAPWQGAEIQPLAAESLATEGDQLAALIAGRAQGGPKVSAWTVLLHNTHLGMAHPDHVMRTAHGDPSFYGLCPSSPAARDYARRLVAGIAALGPDRIEVESPDFMGFAHGYHHEKDGLPALPEDEFLLGLCFCRHCLARARMAGVPAEAARLQVRDLLDRAFAREVPCAQFPDFPARGLAAFDALPDLAAFLRWRTEPVTSLLAELRAACPVPLWLIDHPAAWWGGVDRPALLPHVDGLVFCAYRTPAPEVGPLFAALRAEIGPAKGLVAGFWLFHPQVADRADLAARVAAARPHVSGTSFYNLGLVPPARLDWIRTALG